MDLDRLKDPFPADAIEWRIGQSGKTRDGRPWAKVLAYLTNRAIMDRLDEVCGPAGWTNEFRTAPNDPEGKSVLCGVGVKFGGEWLWKWDGASNTDFEAVKGGLSDGMKRAAVQWGVGRYLYGIGESWAECTEENMRGQDSWRYAKTKDGVFWWKPPELPAWALPAAQAPAPVKHQPSDRGLAAATAAPMKRPSARRTRTETGASVSSAPVTEGPDYRRLVLDTLTKVCRCEGEEQQDAVLNYVTNGLYTSVGELDAPEDARKVHTLLREYGRKNRLQGLALSNEIGTALGL